VKRRKLHQYDTPPNTVVGQPKRILQSVTAKTTDPHEFTRVIMLISKPLGLQLGVYAPTNMMQMATITAMTTKRSLLLVGV
jgi:hypothetical protein